MPPSQARVARIAVAVGLTLSGLDAAARAQSAEPFYKGKTINLISGFSPGGSYDFYTRLLSRHMGRHIPGAPSIVFQSVPGAGGLNAANHLYRVAPRDGTAIAMLSQTLAIEEALAMPGVQYRAAELYWIGRVAATVEVSLTWHTSKARSIEDTRATEILYGTSGPGSALDSYPRVLAFAAGLKFRFITGYKGSTEALLAMERGEVDGSGTTWNTLKINRKAWLDARRINILVQYSRTRLPELADVPAAVELARTPQDRALLEFYMSGADVGRAILAPPGVPADRIAELRAAFDAAMKDAELVADIDKAKAEFSPLGGVDLQRLVADTLAVRPELADRIRQALQAAR